LKKLVAYFIKYPVAVNVVIAAIAVFGYFSYKSITSTFFPIIPNRFIQVNLVYPGASPEEMEEGIVIKIEENLKSITGIERITSTSSENAANVKIEVFKGYDPEKVLNDVKNAVERINSLPVGLETPVVFRQENANFTISFALSADNINIKSLKDIARNIEDDFLRHNGISKVEIKGFPEEEIEIAFKEDALQAYNITFDQAANAVKGSNLEITGGTVKGVSEELLIRAKNKNYYAQGFEEIVVKAGPQGVVRLKDVATIRDRWSDKPDKITLNGKSAVEIVINNTDSEDILGTSKYVNEYVKNFNKENSHVKATIIRDQAITLNERQDLLVKNGVAGILLVLLFLSLFLNWRIAYWVAASFPISFFGMFIIAAWLGVTVNVISLFGMIVVIGILVDDGIVVSENVYQHYENGKTPIRAAIDGTLEVLPAVFSAVLTTLVAFGTFFFLEGRAGEFFSEMSIVVIATLSVSLIECIILLPAHLAHSKALQSQIEKNFLEKGMDKVMYFMRDKTYAPALRFALKNRLLTVAMAVGLFIITIGAFKGGIIKATFFPFIERDNIDIALSMPAGTRETITEEKLDFIENAIWEVNEEIKAKREDSANVILYAEKQIGPNTNEGKLNIILLSSEERNMPSYLITNLIREKAGDISEAEKLTYGSSGPFGLPVSVSLLGKNNEELEACKDELKSKMNELASLKDVVDNNQEGHKEIAIKLKEKAYLLGLRERDIMAQVRQGFFGNEVQRIQRGVDEIKVWVRYDEKDRGAITNLEDMRIRTADGGQYPLRELVTYTIERGIVNINHLDGQREIKVEADVKDPNVSVPEILSQVKTEILPPILAKYPGVTPLYEGQNREAGKTQKSAATTVPVVLIFILIIITFTFRSFAQAIIVFLIIPLSIVGVAWGHYIHNLPLSIFSYLGIFALIGIIVNDSLVLVSRMNQYLKEGESFKNAVYLAGVVRFRAIFLTSITTIGGLAPLILEKSFQAQFLIPMAIAVAYGIGIATLLTLVVLPVFLSLYSDMKLGAFWLWNAKSTTPELLEPAIIEMEAENAEIEENTSFNSNEKNHE
jgi:multidrug efflux pump subunit AcrB